MNLLSIYLMKEKFLNASIEEGTINLNRLIQKMPVKLEDFQEFHKKNPNNNNILHKIDENYAIIHTYMKKENVEGGSFVIPLQDACIPNLFNSALKMESEQEIFYNLDKLMNENELTPHISKIKDFLKIIVNKNVYKQAIKKLFPQYYSSLTSNNSEEIKQYIDERIKFYPFQNLDLSGITDKLSCYSFIPCINFVIERHNKSLITNATRDSYNVGLTIVNSIHEINHANQVIIFFKGNNRELLYSPERIIEENIPVSEGGNSLEYLLFGKIIGRIDLFECLYIMNEDNYEQNLEQFRENFRKIKDIVIETKGETKFIKIENGIFKSFYVNAIKDIQKIIEHLEQKTILTVPKIYIEKLNKPEDDEDYIALNKCALFGGG